MNLKNKLKKAVIGANMCILAASCATNESLHSDKIKKRGISQQTSHTSCVSSISDYEFVRGAVIITLVSLVVINSVRVTGWVFRIFSKYLKNANMLVVGGLCKFISRIDPFYKEPNRVRYTPGYDLL